MKRRNPIASGFALCLVASSASGGQPAPWARMAAMDVEYVRRMTARSDIYAVVGDPAFGRAFEQATAEARRDTAGVNDLKTYQALLKRYIGALQDPHARIRFNSAPNAYAWPSFLVRMRGDRYYAVGSLDARIVDGAEVTQCDGRPIDAILDAMAPLEGSVVGLQSSRAAMARLLTVDAGNPYYRRIQRCMIGGGEVELNWSPVTADALALHGAPYAPFRDPGIWSKPFGVRGSWIHLGAFAADAEQAAQYHALYRRLPQMRDDDVIVVDVRGNSGGSYNWFMGFLRALYGDDVARHYARARLKIRAVFASSPSAPHPSNASDAPSVEEPLDAELVAAEGRVAAERLPNGRTVYRLPPVRGSEDPVDPPPANPVRARVLLLTDNGCASACIAFADEMLRFPRVTMIGADTFVDRLSGTPITTPLPSGNGTLGLPSMIRYARVRGDNVPRRPAFAFDGDLADTAAVQAWIVNVVLQSPIPESGERPR